MEVEIYKYNGINKISNRFIEIYCGSFPKDERRDWQTASDVESFVNRHKDKFNILIIKTEDIDFAGFLTYWNFDTFVYVEHFAICESMRGNGLGMILLDYLIDNICDKIVLEVERPIESDVMTKKRIEFYVRKGFKLVSDIDYIQPPYTEKSEAVPLYLMTHGQLVFTGIDDPRLELLKNSVYGRLV